MASMESVKVKAPAKVNTMLRVVARREDGFHDLRMVMVPLSLADEIELSSIERGIELSIDGQSDAGMAGEKNLAWRAASLMLEAAGRTVKASGFGTIRLLKGVLERIPLADGSVDAIISNCVINLAGDKAAVLREALRVLRPGGRLCVADTTFSGSVPDAIRSAGPEAWCG